MKKLKLKKKSVSLPVFLGILCVVFLFSSSNIYAAKKPSFKNTGKNLGSLLEDKSRAQRVLKKGSSSQFKRMTVEIGEGTRDNLGNIAKVVFASQTKFQKRISAIKPASKILLGRPVFKSETYEFADSFLLLKSTKINVVNPALLAKTSPEFKSFLGKKGGKSKIKLSDLSKESRQGMKDFIEKELPRLPNNDPLKVAALKGEQALLDAISAGVGTFETIEEVVVPKKLPPRLNGVPQLPVIENGVFNFNKYRPSKLDLLRKIGSLRESSIDRTVGKKLNFVPEILKPARHSTKMTSVQESGTRTFNDKFITGYTLGSNWDYCRTWKFKSGLFRVRAGAGYTIGLRFPIAVNGEVTPTHITTSGVNDIPRSFETSIVAKPIDADCAFYRQVGMPNETDRTCGKELALDFYVGFGVKFRALWTTVADEYWELPEDPYFSDDFTPPYNRNRGGIKLWIPKEVSQMGVDLGVVAGAVKIGFRLSGTGTIDFGYKTFSGNETTMDKRLEFKSPNAIKTESQVRQIASTGGTAQKTENYGFSLFDPVYKIHPTITPGIQIGVRLGYRGFSRSINTAEFWLSSLEMLLLPVSFPRHDDTNDEFEWHRGKKIFNPR